MGKAELIEKYGEEWYEQFKERCRIRSKAAYDADPEKERARRRKRYARNPQYTKDYNKAHHEIYRINTRDRNRLRLLQGMNLDGLHVHHLKYHRDNKDEGWRDDIMIMTTAEHTAWHKAHPEFIAAENII